jgi:hypothetical protein
MDCGLSLQPAGAKMAATSSGTSQMGWITGVCARDRHGSVLGYMCAFPCGGFSEAALPFDELSIWTLQVGRVGSTRRLLLNVASRDVANPLRIWLPGEAGMGKRRGQLAGDARRRGRRWARARGVRGNEADSARSPCRFAHQMRNASSLVHPWNRPEVAAPAAWTGMRAITGSGKPHRPA